MNNSQRTIRLRWIILRSIAPDDHRGHWILVWPVRPARSIPLCLLQFFVNLRKAVDYNLPSSYRINAFADESWLSTARTFALEDPAATPPTWEILYLSSSLTNIFPDCSNCWSSIRAYQWILLTPLQYGSERC